MLNKYIKESAKPLSLSDNSIPKSVDVTFVALVKQPLVGSQYSSWEHLHCSLH